MERDRTPQRRHAPHWLVNRALIERVKRAPRPIPPQELNVARRGKGMDPAAGSWDIDPVFETSAFKFGYLVRALAG